MSGATYEWDAVSQTVIKALAPAVEAVNQFSFIGEATHFVKTPNMDAQLLPTASSLGMDVMLFKYTISLFLVYPLALTLYYLPGKGLKHLFSFVVGFLMVQWIFGPDWIHTFITSLATYLMTRIIPGKSMPVIVFIVIVSYMVLAHGYKMYTSYLSGIFDFTGTQMVLTMKLTSYAWNIYDGIHDRKKVFAENADPKDRVLASRRKYAIKKYPNIIEFFGYIYCFTCILAGPAFEYSDYAAAIDDSAFEVPDAGKKDDNAADKKKRVVKRPLTLIAGLTRLLMGVVCMVLYLKVTPLYKLTTLYDKEFIATHSFLERLAHLLLSMFGERQKYYFAWKVAEGASILAGFGFEGYTADASKTPGFGGVENIDIIGFETATNIATATRVWNKRTQGWLERYTYQRTNRSLIITYLVSALWHGLYPGFFCVFLSMPLVTEVERLIRAKINPLFIPSYDPKDPKSYPSTPAGLFYKFICWIGSILTMNYVAQTFSMGSLERSLTALGSLHYCGHIAFAVSYVLLSLLPTPRSGSKKSAEKTKAQ
mmetsp:Transcript_31851/g.23568  ORF Transcript_31851/g.23568 Transcript_31851/m.23568 type:complete len:539 (+) Transcript_31851:74-1690(+)